MGCAAGSTARRNLGVVMIVLNQVLNAGSGELMQFQESGGEADAFDAPVSSIWFNHSTTGLLSLAVALALLAGQGVGTGGGASATCWGRQLQRVEAELCRAGYSAAPLPPGGGGGGGWADHSARALGICSRLRCCAPCAAVTGGGSRVATWRALGDATLLVLLYKFNIAWASAVPHVTITVFMAITQCGCVVVFVLSVLLLGETCTRGKLGAVGLCLGGVALVCTTATAGGGTDVTTTALGLALTVAYTMGAAVYNVAWRLTPSGVGGGGVGGGDGDGKAAARGAGAARGAAAAGADAPLLLVAPEAGSDRGGGGEIDSTGCGGLIPVWLFLGLMGVANIALCWPLMWIADATGWERFALPAGWGQWQLVLSNALVAWLCNVTLMLGLTLTTPLVVAVGGMLQLPFSAAFDAALHGIEPAPLQLAGYVLITAGFGLMSKLRATEGGSAKE